MSLSGSELTRIGVLGSPGIAYAGFLAKAETDVSLWSTVTGNASIWQVVNPTETTWDTNTTFWDLNGNVYTTIWDDKDNTWGDVTTNPATWTDQ